jgi:hypothetical protein
VRSAKDRQRKKKLRDARKAVEAGKARKAAKRK